MEYPAVNANNTQFRKGDKYIWGVYIFLIIVAVVHGYPSGEEFRSLGESVKMAMKSGPYVLIITYLFYIYLFKQTKVSACHIIHISHYMITQCTHQYFIF